MYFPNVFSLCIYINTPPAPAHRQEAHHSQPAPTESEQHGENSIPYARTDQAACRHRAYAEDTCGEDTRA